MVSGRPERHWWDIWIERPLLILFAIFVVCMVGLFRPYLHGVDPYGYYAWVSSLIIDGRINAHREFLSHICGATRSPCLYKLDPYGVGTGLFWSPFFLIGNLLAPLLGATRNGYSAPYVALCAFGSSLYAFAGLLLSWTVAKQFYAVGITTIATITIWLGSPLLFYMVSNSLLSHGVDVLVNGLFLLMYVRTRGAPSRLVWVGYGLLIGLAMLVRTENIWLLTLPVVESVARLWRRERGLLTELFHYVLTGVGLIVGFLPQIAVWKESRGVWLLTNPYAAANGDHFDYLHPHLLEVIFSSNRGMLLWAPAFLVALCGLPLVLRRDVRLGAGLCALFLLHFYTIASWTAWSGAASFGPRLFLDCVPLAVFGLSALLDTARRYFPVRLLVCIAAFLVLWTLLLMGQYALQLVPRAGPVSIGTLVENQVTLVPDHIGHLLQVVLHHRRH